MRVVRDFRGDHVLALAGLPQHVDGRVQRDRVLDELPPVVGVRDGARRAFAVVQRVRRAAGLAEHQCGFELGLLGGDADHAAVVAQVEDLLFAAAGDVGPAALGARARLGFALGVGVGLDDGA